MAKRRSPQNPGAPAALVDSISPRAQAAHSLWNEGRHDDAFDLFAEAIRREPNNVRTYVMAARAYAEAFDFERMDRTHAKLLERAPRHPGVQHYIGETYTLLKLPERALASLREAAQLPGAGPPTWMELASLCERAHRLEEAEELIERAVNSGYTLPLVALIRGRIQRRQNRLAEAEATFRALIQQIPADTPLACQVWGELALMKDNEGDWDAAIDVIQKCKRVQMAHEAPHLAASQTTHANLLEMVTSITVEDLSRWQQETCDLQSARVALLTGFPRSGTTLLEQMLDAHPDLISSEERDFVGRELLRTLMAKRGTTPILDVVKERSVAQIEADRKRYFQAMEYLLGEPIGGRMHLDKNPAYNLVLPLVLRLLPETRLIVALRDPRDVVLSCYLRYLPLNAISVRFLDIERTAEKYALDMNAWLKIRELTSAPWCEIRYEDTVADAAGQARKALDTLGLPWNDEVMRYRDRLADTKRVTSPSYEAVAKPIYTRAVGRWKNYEKLLEPAFDVLEPFVREFGYDK